MTRKAQARQLGRVLRRGCGFPFPTAHRVAGLLVRRGAAGILQHADTLAPKGVSLIRLGGDCDTCGLFRGTYRLTGPTGSLFLPLSRDFN